MGGRSRLNAFSEALAITLTAANLFARERYSHFRYLELDTAARGIRCCQKKSIVVSLIFESRCVVCRIRLRGKSLLHASCYLPPVYK